MPTADAAGYRVLALSLAWRQSRQMTTGFGCERQYQFIIA
jgi:hypothetical protein